MSQVKDFVPLECTCGSIKARCATCKIYFNKRYYNSKCIKHGGKGGETHSLVSIL